MSTPINAAAEAARESHRSGDGKFGSQPHSNPGQLPGLTEEQPTCTTLPDGSKMWYLHGRLHRTDGPAIEYADGSKEWRLHGKLHRTDGPAVEWADGTKQWYVHGKLHRTDGPAVEWADGSKEWWLHSEKVGEAEHAQRTA